MHYEVVSEASIYHAGKAGFVSHEIFEVNSREPESFLRLALDPVNAQPPGTQ